MGLASANLRHSALAIHAQTATNVTTRLPGVRKMFNLENPLTWAAGAAFLVVVGFWLRSRFSTEVREARRRRRSYGRVISKMKSPTVKLAVKTEKRADDR
jgi:hypothetical protein